MATATDVLRVATAELAQGGRHWTGSSTRSLYTRWYGMDGYWCAMFVSWCAAEARATAIIPRHAYTPSGAQWFKDKKRWHNGRSGIKRGDIVYYKFGTRIDHVGIVETVYSDGSISAIEGNTSGAYGGSQRSGGVVARKRRKSNIAGYGRPAYSGSTSITPVAKQDKRRHKIEEDGYLGPDTIGQLQLQMGTPYDRVISYPKSALTAELQTWLNVKGCKGYNGKKLEVDGKGLYSNVNGKTPKTNTNYALQTWMKTTRDGVLDSPSPAVRELQGWLNRGVK